MTVEPDPPYGTRLTALFAAKARVAVILRRGPKRSFRLVRWDLVDDTFIRGQWMSGIIRLCDLSPCGTKLIYWAAQYHRPQRPADAAQPPFDPLRGGAASHAAALVKRKRKVPRYIAQLVGPPHPMPRPNSGTWTAISTPPFFTALAIWPAFGHWTGGAVFASEQEIVLNETGAGLVAVENVRIPSTFRITPLGSVRAGKSRVSPSALAPGTADEETRQALIGAGCRWVDWISRHDHPDMLFAADGRIYRLPQWEKAAKANYLADARMLIDLRADSFSSIAAPISALRW